LVKRAIELSASFGTGKAIRAFIGVNPTTGKVTPRRPAGIAPTGDEVIFEPTPKQQEG
jgi:hypothetical protein